MLGWGVLSTSPNPHAGGPPPCRLSAIAYSMYSELPSILEAVPQCATWGHPVPWWRRPTYHGMPKHLRELTFWYPKSLYIKSQYSRGLIYCKILFASTEPSNVHDNDVTFLMILVLSVDSGKCFLHYFNRCMANGFLMRVNELEWKKM